MGVARSDLHSTTLLLDWRRSSWTLGIPGTHVLLLLPTIRGPRAGRSRLPRSSFPFPWPCPSFVFAWVCLDVAVVVVWRTSPGVRSRNDTGVRWPGDVFPRQGRPCTVEARVGWLRFGLSFGGHAILVGSWISFSREGSLRS